MTDVQLYLSIGVPTFAVVIGMLFNGLLFQSLSARMTGLEARFLGLEERFQLLEGAVHEMDKRLVALEVKLEGR